MAPDEVGVARAVDDRRARRRRPAARTGRLPIGRDDRIDDRRQLGEAPDARLARGELARLGLDDRVAELVAQPRDVRLRRRVRPHVAVHRRRDHDRGARGEAAVAVTTSPGSPWAIAPSQCAVAGATTMASARVGDHDVADPPVGEQREDVGLDRVARQRRERQRPDERASPPG